MTQPEYDFRIDRPVVTLRHRVVDAIRNAIILGRYDQGARMPERELCEMIGVSRTLVREALRQLETEGLIEVVPNKGPHVTKITPKQATDLYQVRELLEGLAAELFARNATPAHRARLHEALNRVQTSYALDDVLVRLQAKNTFYAVLIEGAGNEALGDALHNLNSRTTRLRALSVGSNSRRGGSLQEIVEIVAAIDAGDAGLARARAEHHVRRAYQTVANLLK